MRNSLGEKDSGNYYKLLILGQQTRDNGVDGSRHFLTFSSCIPFELASRVKL